MRRGISLSKRDILLDDSEGTPPDRIRLEHPILGTSMRLHLPSSLRKALLVCLAAVSSALPGTLPATISSASGIAAVVALLSAQQAKAAGVLSTQSTDVNGKIYAGEVVDMANNEHFVEANFWVGDSEITGMSNGYLGSDGTLTTEGVSTTFWINTWTNASGTNESTHGHTLRLGFRGDNSPGVLYSYTINFQPLFLGGLIVQESVSSQYQLGLNANRQITLQSGASNVPVRFTIGSDMTIIRTGGSTSNVCTATLNSDGIFEVAAGKILSWEYAKITGSKNLEIQKIGDGEGVAIMRIAGGSISLTGDSTLTIENGAELQISGGSESSVSKLAGGGTLSVEDAVVIVSEETGFTGGKYSLKQGGMLVVPGTIADGKIEVDSTATAFGVGVSSGNLDLSSALSTVTSHFAGKDITLRAEANAVLSSLNLNLLKGSGSLSSLTLSGDGTFDGTITVGEDIYSASEGVIGADEGVQKGNNFSITVEGTASIEDPFWSLHLFTGSVGDGVLEALKLQDEEGQDVTQESLTTKSKKFTVDSSGLLSITSSSAGPTPGPTSFVDPSQRSQPGFTWPRSGDGSNYHDLPSKAREGETDYNVPTGNDPFTLDVKGRSDTAAGENGGYFDVYGAENRKLKINKSGSANYSRLNGDGTHQDHVLKASQLWLTSSATGNNNRYAIGAENYLSSSITEIYINKVGVHFTAAQNGLSAYFSLGAANGTSDSSLGADVSNYTLRVENNTVTTSGYLELQETALVLLDGGGGLSVGYLTGPGDLRLGSSTRNNGGTLYLTGTVEEGKSFTGSIEFVRSSTVSIARSTTHTIGGIKGSQGEFRASGEGDADATIKITNTTPTTASDIVFESGVVLEIDANSAQAFGGESRIQKLKGAGTLGAKEGKLTVDDFSEFTGKVFIYTGGTLALSSTGTEPPTLGADIRVSYRQEGSLEIAPGTSWKAISGKQLELIGGLTITTPASAEEEETVFELNGVSLSGSGVLTAGSGVTIKIGENQDFTSSEITLSAAEGGCIDLNGQELGSASLRLDGGKVENAAGALTLADESTLFIQSENLVQEGQQTPKAVINFEKAGGSLKLAEGTLPVILLNFASGLLLTEEGEDFNVVVQMVSSDASLDGEITSSNFRVRQLENADEYIYYVEPLEGGQLQVRGSTKFTWKASAHGDIDSFDWNPAMLAAKGDPRSDEGADWRKVLVDENMFVTLAPEGDRTETTLPNLQIKEGATLTVANDAEDNDALSVNLLAGEVSGYSASVGGGIEEGGTLKGEGNVIFDKTGKDAFSVRGAIEGRNVTLQVTEGTLEITGEGSAMVGKLGDIDEAAALKLDGKLDLKGESILTAESGGSISGGGALSISNGASLDVSAATNLNWGDSLIALDTNDSGSFMTGTGEVMLSSMRGKGTVSVGNGGILIQETAEVGEYSGKLGGGGAITVKDGGKQRFISWDAKESSQVSLVSGRNGEVHLRGGSSRGSTVTQYKDITVQTEKDDYGHEAYGKLYVECEDGRNSSIRVSGDITLEKGTTIYLQFDTSSGLGSKGSNDRTGSGAQALLHANGEIKVDNLVKFVITLGGDSNGFNPEEELNLVLMEGGRGCSYGGGSTLYRDDLTLDPLLKVYYENIRVEFGSGLVELKGDMRTESPLEGVAGTANSKAGADLLWERRGDADLRDRESALYKVYTGIMEMGEKNPRGASKALAAVAGSSAAALGSAQRDAMRGQIGRMRDRASQLGLAGGYSYDSLPYWHAWVEGEGAYNKLSEDGDESGYRLSSWGGSFGVDADLTERTAFGMAVTAMHGDLKTSGADAGSGDLDSYYVSAMLRIQRRRSAHTVVASIGADDAKLERQVNYGTGSYRSSGSTSGESFGALYEYTYDMPGNARGTALLQPLVTASVMHGSIKDYDESGADALPLHVDKQDWTTATVGVGLRWMCTIGENVLNRSAIFEARGAVMQDIGDTQGKVRVGLLKAPEVLRDVESAEVGSTAVQLSIGLRAPVSEQAQVFFNAGTELRSGMTSWNLAAGLRYDF